MATQDMNAVKRALAVKTALKSAAPPSKASMMKASMASPVITSYSIHYTKLYDLRADSSATAADLTSLRWVSATLGGGADILPILE